MLHCRIVDLERVNEDLNVTITSKADDVECKEQVLAELRHDMQGMSGLISTVGKELQIYQVCFKPYCGAAPYCKSAGHRPVASVP